jgi:hypothetical protein
MSIVLGKRLESFQQVTLEAVVITEVPELEAVVVLVPDVVIVDEALLYTVNSKKTSMFLSRKGMSDI